MNPSLEETVYLDFTTHRFDTGAVTDADSTPSVEVFEDATDTAILTPTATKRTSKTGNYRVPVACTAANGFEAGKSYNVVASATVNSVTGKGVIGRFQVRTRDIDDVATQASVDTVDDFLDTEIAAIKAKTDNLPSDPADASDIAASFTSLNTKVDTIDDFLDTEIAAIKAKTDNLPASPANEATLTTIAGYLDTEVAAILAAVDTEVAAIKAKTDNLPSDPADASDISSAFSTVNTTLSTIAGYVDTEVAAIKAKTDLIPSDPADASDISALIDALPTAAENAAALLDLTDGVETGLTPRQALRLMAAALGGKLSGAATTTITIRNTADTANRITATVDADGNRSAVTLNL